jgi:hypothetical protein
MTTEQLLLLFLRIVLWALAVALYFLPAMTGHRKANGGAIFALNLFLGWTFVGWVVALVWALTKDAPAPPNAAMIEARRILDEQRRQRAEW